MDSITLSRVTAKSAADVLARFEASEEARKLLREGMPPAGFLKLLIENELWTDAVRFLAHALPKRESTGWACLCARRWAGASPSPAVGSALRAAERWVAVPNEEHRREAMAQAEQAGVDNPAGCAAQAAFWSGGSLAPSGAPEVPPAEHLTATAVAGAVMLAAVIREPEKAPEKYRAFLAQGIDIANGRVTDR